jgi:hypothetical protein
VTATRAVEDGKKGSHLLSNFLQMPSHKTATAGMKKHREAPRVSKDDQMRFAREVVDRKTAEAGNLILCGTL